MRGGDLMRVACVDGVAMFRCGKASGADVVGIFAKGVGDDGVDVGIAADEFRPDVADERSEDVVGDDELAIE